MVMDKSRREGSATAQELDFYREKNKRRGGGGGGWWWRRKRMGAAEEEDGGGGGGVEGASDGNIKENKEWL